MNPSGNDVAFAFAFGKYKRALKCEIEERSLPLAQM